VPDDYRTRLREEVTTQLSRYAPDATAVFGLDFGHTDPHFPLPLGAQVTLDRETETVRFE
jgi:muramoyltetrapeptide carboxypeptidase LdcA involved in peptidoglycan recycling